MNQNLCLSDLIKWMDLLEFMMELDISHYFAKIKVDSLLIEKRLTLHNVIIHIKSVLNKDKSTNTIRYF